MPTIASCYPVNCFFDVLESTTLVSDFVYSFTVHMQDHFHLITLPSMGGAKRLSYQSNTFSIN